MNLCYVLELPSNLYIIFLSSFGQGRSILEEKLDFKGGNVHVITTKEDWDQKIEEANKDGKIVSKLSICSRDYNYPLLLIMLGMNYLVFMSISLHHI